MRTSKIKNPITNECGVDIHTARTIGVEIAIKGVVGLDTIVSYDILLDKDVFSTYMCEIRDKKNPNYIFSLDDIKPHLDSYINSAYKFCVVDFTKGWNLMYRWNSICNNNKYSMNIRNCVSDGINKFKWGVVADIIIEQCRPYLEGVIKEQIAEYVIEYGLDKKEAYAISKEILNEKVV